MIADLLVPAPAVSTAPKPDAARHPLEFDPLEKGRYADMRALLAGDLSAELPTVSPALGGKCLFYRGRVNEIHAEPGVGKSNLLTAAAIPELQSGGLVLYIDPEDNAKAVARRFLAFGCDRESIIHGLRHSDLVDDADLRWHAAWAVEHRPALVIIDGCAEILARLGLDEDKPRDFLRFCHEWIAPFAATGAAVVLADHVTKSAESRGRWSRGTGAKLGVYDGASYQIDLGRGYTPTQAGFIRLKVAKDRQGGVGIQAETVAEVHFLPGENGRTLVEFRSPEKPGGGSGLKKPFEPTTLMELVSRRLEEVPDSTLTQLRRLGRAEYVDRAIDALQASGHLKVDRRGPGRPALYSVLKPYRDSDEN